LTVVPDFIDRPDGSAAAQEQDGDEHSKQAD
jgi:hypothetical protein